MSLRVLACGPFCLLQDSGRLGWQGVGVSPSGPVDIHAASWANRLLGNAFGTPLLEIALGAVELEAQCDTWLALAGADLPVTLDGEALPAWSRFRVRPGQRLKLGFVRAGQRAYLAAAGGFRAEPVLGSVATQFREKLGGLGGQGAPLAAGDFLQCEGLAARFERGASVPWSYRPDYREVPTLRVLSGPDVFPEVQREAFFRQTWQISPQSDRMGVRLRGAALQPPRRQWSLGVVDGAIQIPRMASRSSCSLTARPWAVTRCSASCTRWTLACWRNARRTATCVSSRRQSSRRKPSCAGSCGSSGVENKGAPVAGAPWRQPLKRSPWKVRFGLPRSM